MLTWPIDVAYCLLDTLAWEVRGLAGFRIVLVCVESVYVWNYMRFVLYVEITDFYNKSVGLILCYELACPCRDLPDT